MSTPQLKPSSSSVRSARVGYALGCVATIGLGLASRRYSASLPPFVARYAGDTLWAAMVFLGLSLLLPQRPAPVRAAAALAFCFMIEFTQLHRRPWLDEVRATTLGSLVLGQGFLASDLLCYTVGVGIAVSLDVLCVAMRRRVGTN